MNFASEIEQWYHLNKRALPWRDSGNAYFVWLSEVIMQQTRIAQGTAYFNRFVEKYPTVKLLADASEDDVLKLWEGLGYYSRARNLHAGAKQIVDDFGGKMPTNYKELLSIKGIGPYSAAAISSICFNQNVAVVDGNVFRVLSRLYGIETPINTSAGAKIFAEKAASLINNVAQPGEYNQAVMEFGALHCTPKSPDCLACIFNTSCVAFLTGQVANLPVKHKAKPLRNRYLNYFIKVVDAKIVIEKRTEKDIWQGLYQFPLLESDAQKTRIEHARKIAEPIVHILSHQRLHITIWMLKKEHFELLEQQILVSPNELQSLAFPIPLKRFIESNLLHLPNFTD